MREERQVIFWLVALALFILVVALLKDILLPFVAGLVIAYFLNPLADRLSAMGLNRMLASALIVLGLGVLTVALLVLVAPVLLSQAQQFAVALPAEVERLRALTEAWARAQLGPLFPQFEEGLRRASQASSEGWANIATWAATSLWSHGVALFNFVSILLVTPLVVFYVLADWHPMLRKIDGWLPRAHAPTVRALAAEINDAVSAFIRGQGTVCIILGVFYAMALSAIGLNYGLLIGLGTGIMGFVPFVGWALGLITASGVAIVQYWPETTPLLMVIGVFFAGQAIDAGFLSPNIVGSKIGLHPVWLIFALFTFSYLFGFVGVLVAVPVAAAIGVLVRFALDVYLGSSVYGGEIPSRVAAETVKVASP